MLFRTLVFNAVLALLLFIPAGTWRWPQAWLLIAVLDVGSLAIGAWLMRRDPALLAERMVSPVARDQRPRDRVIMFALLVVFALWCVALALDARRFQLSHVPPWLQGVGAVAIVLPYAGWVAVLRENSFASTRIKLQTERDQAVISSGPYAIVRHPMYSLTLPFLAGISLLLGSYWGLLIGAVLVVPLLVARILGEEALLRHGLPGYRDYAARVRWRLIPGLW